MKQKLVIPGRLPNLNDIIASSKVMGSQGHGTRGRRWSSYAQLKLNTELPIINLVRATLKPVKKPVFLAFDWYEPNKRRDIDGVSSGGRKFCLDALVSAGILPDDGWKWIKGFSDRFFVDKDRPRVEVTIVN